MLDIRGLLSQSLTAPEIIAEGYSPSSFYRVKQDIQRKLAVHGNSHRGGGTSTSGLECWGELEAENQRMGFPEDRLGEMVRRADADLLTIQVTEIQRVLEQLATQTGSRVNTIGKNAQAIVAGLDCTFTRKGDTGRPQILGGNS